MAGLLAAMSLLLTACSSGHGFAQGREGDIAFVQDMIPHHEQALELAELALTNATAGSDVRGVARQIARTQDPEVVLMRQWLADWGAQERAHGAGVEESSEDGHAMPGMASSADLLALADSRGREFDQRWLDLMIAHHEGAIAMAEQVAASTEDPLVKALADAIVDGQAAEIEQMRAWLD